MAYFIWLYINIYSVQLMYTISKKVRKQHDENTINSFGLNDQSAGIGLR